MKCILAVVALACVVATGGCSSSGLHKAEGLEVAARLPRAPKGASVYQYLDPDADLLRYRRILLEPVALYRQADHGFGDIPQAQREALMRFIDARAPEILGGGAVKLADAPGPDVLRLRLTLVGMTRSRPVLQGVSYAIPVGAALNIAKGAAGGTGVFMGSVTLAGEFHDSSTGALVAGFLAMRSPNAVNLKALAGESAAAELGALSLLEELRARLDARAAERR